SQRITEPARRTMTAVPSSDASYTLRLCEDTLPAGGRGALGALNRVLYARRGSVTVASAPRETRLAEGEAWYGARVCQIVAAGAGGQSRGQVVRERARARAGGGLQGRADQLRSRRDPPARDPRADVHRVRRSEGRRARPTADLHGVRGRADRARLTATEDAIRGALSGDLPGRRDR